MKMITGKIAKLIPQTAPARYGTYSSFINRATNVSPITIAPVVTAAQMTVSGS